MLKACIKMCHPLAEYSISVLSGIFLGLGLIYFNVPIILISICMFISLLTHIQPFTNQSNPSMVFLYCFMSTTFSAYITKVIVKNRKNRNVSDTIKTKYQ